MIVDGVYLERATAVALAPALSRWARNWEHDQGARLPVAVRRFVDELEQIARAERVRNVRNTATEDSAHDAPASPDARLLLSTQAAAQALGITDRAVRGLCVRGTLAATHTGRGWQIEPDSVTAYRTRSTP